MASSQRVRAVGLDPDHHLLGFLMLATVPGDQGVQPGDALDALHQPGYRARDPRSPGPRHLWLGSAGPQRVRLM
ncbi:hypothetical protein ACIRL2_40395 [Embleya sp. NPDC127516]|uniref:hypothetical protein n=1 Tax=Embleya sp. NPDC127516 TaxID=3363990 RepID=UPI0038194481